MFSDLTRPFKLSAYFTLVFVCSLVTFCGVNSSAGTVTAINRFISNSADQVVCVTGTGLPFNSSNITATFGLVSCTINGPTSYTATVNVQWYVNSTGPSNSGGNPISGASQTGASVTGNGTSVTFTLSGLSFIPTSATGKKWYYCVITSQSRTDCGNATTYNSGVVEVNVVNAPLQGSWVSQPSVVCRGVANTFEVTGMQPANSYSWTYSGSGGTIGGATNSSLVTLTLGAGSTVGTLTVTAVGCNGGSNSLVTSITIINDPPSITSQPTSAAQSTCLNTSFTTNPSVTASAGTYQWYRNTVQSNSGGTLISGATLPSYVAPVNVAGTTYFYCIVTNNSCTTASSVSGAFNVTSSAAVGTISTSPAAACQGQGFSAPLSVSGSGIGAYQWFSNTSNSTLASNLKASTLIPAATSGTYLPSTQSIPTTQPVYYICQLTGCDGKNVWTNFSGAYTVNANPAIPTITNNTSNTNCSGTPNGSLNASSANPIAWYLGSSVSGSSIGSNATLSSLAAGQYTVQATNASGCTSAATATVLNSFAYPTTPTFTNTSNTNCTGTANGQLTASSSAGATFQWFSGPSVSGGAIGNTNTISSLAAGQYTVQATNASGCTSPATATVLNSFTYPSATIAATVANTNCAGTPNGSASATVGGVTAGYNFSWYNGPTVAGSPIRITATASALAAGTYTVQASFSSTGCASPPVQANVSSGLDFSITPSFVSSTNCTGPGNGAVSASVNNSTSGYTFAWYSGASAIGTPLSASNTGTAYTASSLSGGQSYTVSVTSLSSGCTTTSTVYLNDDKVIPVLSLTPVANTRCDATSNGSVSGVVSSDTNFQSGDTYTYAWSSGTNMGALISDQTASSITSRTPGSYTATVTNNRLGCTSAPKTALINNTPATPPSSAVLSSLTTFPVCPNGAVSIKVDVTGGTSPYTFTLSNGSVIPDGYVSGSVASVSPAAEWLLTLVSVSDALGCLASSRSGSVQVSWKTVTEWTAGSGSWDSGANWTCGVPTATLDAIIAVPNAVVSIPSPSLSFNVLSLTVGAGSTLTFGSAASLQVHGNLVNNGTINYSGTSYSGTVATLPSIRMIGGSPQTISGSGLFNIHNLDISNTAGGVTNEATRIDLFNTLSLGSGVSFDADGASGSAVLRLRSTSVSLAGNISMIPSTASFTGKVTVQRNLGQVLTNKWRYVSIPLTGFTLSGQLTEWYTKNAVYWYNETLAGTINTGWVKIPTSYYFGSQQIGLGYQSYNSPSLYEARGDLNQGTIDMPVKYTNNNYPDSDGWNCLGNPYPSTIQWNDTDWELRNMGSVIFIPDNKAGVWRTVDFDGVGTIPSGTIALGQAFWAYATGPDPLMRIRESAKRSDTTRYYRQSTHNRNGLSLALSYNDVEDRAFLFETPGATYSYDPRHDAPKLEGEMMGISVVGKDGRKLVYSHVPKFENQTPLHIWGSEPGRYQFSVSQLDATVAFPELYLIDQLTGKIHQLQQGKKIVLELTSSDNLRSSRFVLSRSNPDAVEGKPFLSVFPNPVKDQVNVHVRTDASVSISLVDIAGAHLLKQTLVSNNGVAIAEFDVSGLKAGTYIIEMEVNGLINYRRFIKF